MTNIPFCKPYVGEEEKRAIGRVIDSGDLTDSALVEQFEEEFAKYVGSTFAVAVSSCTAALFLSLKWLDVKGKDVAVSPLTFTSSASSIIHAGGKPKWTDVDFDTLLMQQPKEDYAVVVHVTGRKADVEVEYVVHDSAHYLERDCYIGSLQCFSFHPTKSITTGFGGMIATNNKQAYEWLKKARMHGCYKSDWKKEQYGYVVEFLGHKMNMNAIGAAMGLEQLKKLDWMNDQRKRCVERYNELLGQTRTGLHLYPIFVRNREDFFEYMKAYEIQCSYHFSPLHEMPAYQDYPPNYPLPNAEWIGKHIVSLPLFPTLTDKQIDYICQKIFNSGQFIL